MTPGPAPVHPRARQASVQPLPHHRTPAFKPRFGRVQAGLGAAFRTASPVAVLAASGTGAMEAALVNVFAPGDSVLVIAAGKFGHRWAEVCSAYGMRVTEIEIAPGAGIEPAAVSAAVTSCETLAGLVMTASETSTGAALDVAALTAAVRRVQPDLAIVVDAITGIGALPIDTDGWGLDAVVGGSQKAFMIPPGLGFVACSRRGWERVDADRPRPRFYLDLRKYRAAAERDQTPFTPATGLLLQLGAALDAIDEVGGISALEDNARSLAAATRAAARAWGLRLLSESSPSPAVTAIRAPVPGSAPQLVATLRDRYGLQIAGGQGNLKPDIFRIGHLGFIDQVDLLATLTAIEQVLGEQGFETQPGVAVAAAAATLAGEDPA